MENSELRHDLLVQSKFKNLILWEAMAGRTVQARARDIGIHPASLYSILNLKLSPFSKRQLSESSVFTSTANRIAQFFNLPPEYLFPESLYTLKLPGVVERSYSSVTLLPLLAARRKPALLGNPEAGIEASERSLILSECLSKLRPREAMVLKMCFGLDDGEEKSLEDIGRTLNVCRKRAYQIKQKALYKLLLKHRKLRVLTFPNTLG